MITTRIVFDHRNRAGKGMGPVEIRIIVDRKVAYVDTGIRCRERDFLDGEIVNTPSAQTDNEHIRTLRDKAVRTVDALLRRGRAVNAREVKRMMSAEEEQGNDFLEWCQRQVPALNVTEGTRKHYGTALRRLAEFGRLSDWNALTAENVCAWDAWLRSRPGGLCEASVYNYHKTLKALINRARMFGRVDRNPYDRLRGRFRRGDKENPEFLTEEEMERISGLRLEEGSLLARARDFFIVQMYTGMGYSDALRLDITRYRCIDGRWTCIARRVKTGVAYVSELLPPVVAALERNGWAVPRLDNADYNHALKLIGQAAGISVPLHSHLARHTFATWMLRHGARIENVSRMLGHTNVAQTQRYAKVLARSVHEDFGRMRALLGGQPISCC